MRGNNMCKSLICFDNADLFLSRSLCFIKSVFSCKYSDAVYLVIRIEIEIGRNQSAVYQIGISGYVHIQGLEHIFAVVIIDRIVFILK